MSISFGLSECVHRSRLTLYIADKDRAATTCPYPRLGASGTAAIRPALRRVYRDLQCAGSMGIESRASSSQETTAIITSYVSRDDVITHLDTLRSFLVDILIGTDQEAVAVDLDGDLHDIYASHIPVCAHHQHMTQ